MSTGAGPSSSPPPGHLFIANTSVVSVYCDAFLCPGYNKSLSAHQEIELEYWRDLSSAGGAFRQEQSEEGSSDEEAVEFDDDSFSSRVGSGKHVVDAAPTPRVVGGPIYGQWIAAMKAQIASGCCTDLQNSLLWRLDLRAMARAYGLDGGPRGDTVAEAGEEKWWREVRALDVCDFGFSNVATLARWHTRTTTSKVAHDCSQTAKVANLADAVLARGRDPEVIARELENCCPAALPRPIFCWTHGTGKGVDQRIASVLNGVREFIALGRLLFVEEAGSCVGSGSSSAASTTKSRPGGAVSSTTSGVPAEQIATKGDPRAKTAARGRNRKAGDSVASVLATIKKRKKWRQRPLLALPVVGTHEALQIAPETGRLVSQLLHCLGAELAKHPDVDVVLCCGDEPTFSLVQRIRFRGTPW